MKLIPIFLLTLSLSFAGDLEKARDSQDRAALDKLAAQFAGVAAQKPADAQAQYQAALAQSYVAEVAIELGDKNKAKSAAETGIKAAQKAVAIKGDVAEYHRVLGTLCGQVIPANVLAGMKWGNCARDEVEKAVSLDPKAAMNYVSRGVGTYYLPSALGGGVDKAIQDFEKAASIDPKLADAQIWLGVALRKAGRNAEARKALEKAVAFAPTRLWAKQQLEKTPAK
jgi:tetratricopeptide (TPR) repeat protein